MTIKVLPSVNYHGGRYFDSYFYRPQRSWGKVIFSQASVILSTGGGAGPERVPAPGGCLVPGGACSRGCLVPRVPAPGGHLVPGGAWS